MPRKPTQAELMRLATRSGLATVHTHCPGIFVAFDPATKLAVVQPATQDDDDPIPPIPDVPVRFPSAGGFRILFNPVPGDECTLHFYEVDPSAFRKLGVPSKAPLKRRHGLYPLAVPGSESDAKLAALGVAVGMHIGSAAAEIVITPAGIQLGSVAAADPLSMASKVDANFVALAAYLAAHVHSAAGSGPPTVPPPTPVPTGSLKLFGE